MCLPTCARPGGPRCYKVPKVKSKADYSGGGEYYNHPPSPDVLPNDVPPPCDAYLPFNEQFTDEDSIRCRAAISEDSQASLRREKSRIAAKVRRQKENQALFRLRLTLPIHMYKATDTAHIRRPVTNYSTTDDDDSGYGDQVDSCAVYAVPSYRVACSMSRSQQLTAPEFEKAVTIRLAGNSLCLYNWLYPEERSEVGGVLHPPEASIGSYSVGSHELGPLDHQHKRFFSQPALHLHSQSLVVLVIDTVENTVVFAPPSYSQLVGLPWNSIIGLQLPELRARQFVAAAAAASTPVSPRFKVAKLLNPHSFCTESLTSPSTCCSFDTSLPSIVSVASSWSSSTFSHKPTYCSQETSWPVTCSDRYSHLTTLIPPDSGSSNQSHNSEDSSEVDSRHSAKDYPGVYAICWASYLLPRNAQSTSSGTIGHSKSLLSNRLGTYSSNSGSTSNLRVYLFNPILNPVATKHVQETDYCASLSVVTSSSMSLTNSPQDNSLGASSSLACSPRSYHLWDSLKFVGAQSSFLSALDHTQADLLNQTLLDLVHPDDLESLAEALNSLTETEPVVTTLHRLRSKAGSYRWSRLMGFLVKRDCDLSQSLVWKSDLLDSSCRTTTHLIDEATKMDDRLSVCSRSRFVTDRMRGRSEECSSEYATPDSAEQVTSQFWLICCHQFVHFANDLNVVRSQSCTTPPSLNSNLSYQGCCVFPGRNRHSSAQVTPSTVARDVDSSDVQFLDSTGVLKRKRSALCQLLEDAPCGEPFPLSYPNVADTIQPSTFDPDKDHLCDLHDLELNWKSHLDLDSGVALANSVEYTEDGLKNGQQVSNSIDCSLLPKLEWSKQAPSIIPDTQSDLNLSINNEQSYNTSMPYSSNDSNGVLCLDSLTQTFTPELSYSQPYSVCSLTPVEEAEYTSTIDCCFHEADQNSSQQADDGSLLPQAEIFAVPHGYFFTHKDSEPSSYMWSTKKRRIDRCCWAHNPGSFEYNLSYMERHPIQSANTVSTERLPAYYLLPDYYRRSPTESCTPNVTPPTPASWYEQPTSGLNHCLPLDPPASQHEMVVLRQL